MRALAAMKNEPPSDANDDDCTIRDKVLAELKRQEWFTIGDWCKIWAADVIVKDGVVHFWLCDDQPQEERRALRVAARTLQGFGESKNTPSRDQKRFCGDADQRTSLLNWRVLLDGTSRVISNDSLPGYGTGFPRREQ